MTTSSYDLPVVMTTSGAVPTDPSVIRSQIVNTATALSPGLTANLPGSLVEDMVSTSTAAVALMDQARVEYVNSLTPYGANQFVLNQLGAVYGVMQGGVTNGSALVVFTGTPGYTVSVGFLVSDGTNRYATQNATVILSTGRSTSVLVVALQPGTWAIPAGSVTQLVTSVPSGIGLTVKNNTAGVPGAAGESEYSFRSRVVQAGLAGSTGATNYVRTLLNQGNPLPLLTSIQQVSGGYQVICAGQDPYYVAWAIQQGLFGLSGIVGSQLGIAGITKANPGVVTMNFSHGLTTGAVETISGVSGMTQVNGKAYTVTVLSPTTFSIGIDTTGFSTYTGGGVITPNPRNVTVSLVEYPDTYSITYVSPLADVVTVACVWNTNSPNFVSSAAVSQQGTIAILQYISGLTSGQSINLLDMQNVFQQKISNLLPAQYLTRLEFTVTINGIEVAPLPGTGTILGNPESYFSVSAGSVTVTQG